MPFLSSDVCRSTLSLSAAVSRGERPGSVSIEDTMNKVTLAVPELGQLNPEVMGKETKYVFKTV